MEHGSSAKKIVTAATALGPRGGPDSEARPVDAADASASQASNSRFRARGVAARRLLRFAWRRASSSRTALWSAAPAVADDVPPVPGVTTTTDAPPDRPYSPPARATKPKPAARSVAPAVRSAPTDHALCTARRSCSGPGGAAPRHRAKHPDRGGSDRSERERPSRSVSPPFRVNLAPLQAIVAVAQRPLVPVSNGRDRYPLASRRARSRCSRSPGCHC